jgi:pyroglutamyl-peptidase
VKRLLVTGFGPFPGIRFNPSAILARRLAADLRLRRAGIAVTQHLLPTTYAEADRLVPALAAQKPDAVLMLGVAGKRKAITPELFARNRLALLAPDAAGHRPERLAIAPGRPAAIKARAPVMRLVAAGRCHGLPVRASRSAGAYLCNYSYWRMLEALPAATPCVFVHVPKLRGQRLDRGADALSAMARGLLR